MSTLRYLFCGFLFMICCPGSYADNQNNSLNISSEDLVAMGLMSDYVETGTSTIATARPFDEKSDVAKRLRMWVKEAMPKGTTLLNYHRSKGWDGTIGEYWILNCPDGFTLLKQQTPDLGVMVDEGKDACSFIKDDTKTFGIQLNEQRSWWIDWKKYRSKTNVRGHVFPHTKGEILYIERITL